LFYIHFKLKKIVVSEMTEKERCEYYSARAKADDENINRMMTSMLFEAAKEEDDKRKEKKKTSACKPPTDTEKEIEESRNELMAKLKSTKSTFMFNDVIGVEDAKKGLRVALCQQNIFVKCYQRGQLQRCKGIMLFGQV
jgi:hypothetical protein